MTLDFLIGLGIGVCLGGVIAGVAAWRIASRRAQIKPPTGKLGDRMGRNAVPDDRYPLW